MVQGVADLVAISWLGPDVRVAGGSRIGFGEVLVIGRQVEVVELVWIQFKIRVMIL